MGKNLLYSFLFFFFLAESFVVNHNSMHMTNLVRITACSKLSARSLFSFPFSFELLV